MKTYLTSGAQGAGRAGIGQNAGDGRTGSDAWSIGNQTNKMIDKMISHRNLDERQRQSVEQLRREFNERMSKADRQLSGDRQAMMAEIRAARRALSDGLTNLLGGPRAG